MPIAEPGDDGVHARRCPGLAAADYRSGGRNGECSAGPWSRWMVPRMVRNIIDAVEKRLEDLRRAARQPKVDASKESTSSPTKGQKSAREQRLFK